MKKCFFLAVLPLLLSGCSSTSSNGVTSVKSTVSGYSAKRQDSMFRVPAPAININSVKQHSFYISDEDLNVVGGDIFKLGYLIGNKAEELSQTFSIERTKSSKGRVSVKGSLFSVKNNSEIQSVLQDTFGRYCDGIGGKSVFNKSSNRYYRAAGAYKLHHICAINSRYHSALVTEVSKSGNRYFQLWSDSNTKGFKLDLELQNESLVAGGWLVTKSGEYIQYSSLAEKERFTLEARPLTVYDAIVFQADYGALLSFRESYHGKEGYHRSFYHPEKYHLSPTRHLVREGNFQIYNLKFNLVNNEVNSYQISFRDLHAIIPGTLKKKITLQEAKKIVAEAQKYQFSNIRSSADARLFVAAYEMNDAAKLTQSASAQLAKNLEREKKLLEHAQIKEFNEATNISQLAKFVAKYQHRDHANLVANAQSKKSTLEKKLRQQKLNQAIEAQTRAYELAYSSGDWERFIDRFYSSDPAKLLQKAQQALRIAKNREFKEEERRIAELNDWRKNLSVGDNTFCGRVIERNESMIRLALSVQLSGYSSQQWLHESEVFKPHKGCINRNGKVFPRG